MGYWKEVAIRRAEGLPDDPDDEVVIADLATCAALLKGEVEGNFVRCPSPGRPAHDRSCHVRFDLRGEPFVYDSAGPTGAAISHVRKVLKRSPAPRVDYTDLIRSIRRESRPAPGTFVETYLRSRGITIPIPPSLRYHPSLWNSENKTRMPGMVAERADLTGNIVTVHRTFLKYDGTSKAPVSKPRLDLHSWLGTAIRLAPVADELMVGEGIETVLSAMQMYDMPGWAAGSAGAIREVALPPEIERIIILADNDPAGHAAANYAAQRWLREGRRVRIARVPEGNDFNDTLMAKVIR